MIDDSKLKRIIKDYLKSKRFIALYEQGYYLLEEKNSEDSIKKLRVLVNLVDEAIKSLDYEERYILENTYIHNSSINWWMQYYSRSTYYRKRKKLIDNFLDMFSNSNSILTN